MKAKKARLISELSVLSLSLLGVVLQLSLSKSPSDAIAQFSYYTLQTNLIVFAVAFANVVFDGRRQESPRVDGTLRILTGGSVLWITVTMTVFHFLLSGYYRPEGLALIANSLLHYITPTAAVIGWLLFEEKSSYKSFYPILWTMYPLAYAVVAIIRGSFTGFYPYWFLNPADEYPQGIGSFANLIIFILVVGVAFVLAGYLMILINRLSLHRKR
ncbi:MAG: Pr6Pr family membrane protein [Mesotoga sp.]|uniref:Pr6Pr family membrane protein n=1 Tax=Mesotoga sp. TaxID=2053577 RepID=UPI0035696C43|nr:Pr6Pr family membrane protein [Thermotogota bacterium]